MSLFTSLFETASKLTMQPESYGALWEPSENVEKCRSCQAKFQLPLLKRKHHCRVCAGVFCDSCCVLPQDANPNQFLNAAKGNFGGKAVGSKPEIDSAIGLRVCDGCKRGETPGEGLRKVIKGQIESARDKESLRSARREGKVGQQEDVTVKALHRLSMLVAVKVGENVGVQFTDIHPSESLKLIRGSAYGEDKNTVQTSKPLPNMGYFEMVNKSKEFFCIKVLRKGGDQKFEVPRPSYIAVPPGGSVHAFFNDEENKDEDRNDLEIIILHKNPNSVPGDLSSVFYDTTLIATTNKISPCAKVETFKNVIFHSVVSKNKNVLLKYKGGGSIITRIGNSVQRVGIIGAILGNRHGKGIIDFGTNIQRIETVFSASS